MHSKFLLLLLSLALAQVQRGDSVYYETDRPEDWDPIPVSDDMAVTTPSSTYSYRPEVKLIDPVVRKDTHTQSFDLAPCGGATRGIVSYEGYPGQLNDVAWFVTEPARHGNCTVRLNAEFEEEEVLFQTLFPSDRSADVNGKFPCGRGQKNSYERKSFMFPKTSCNPCVLQWTFETDLGTIYQCSDIALIDQQSTFCAGRCQHEGVCKNGQCVCRTGFKGEFCELPSKEVNTRFPIWTFLFIVILLALAIGACAVAYFYMMEKRKEKEGKAEHVAD